VGGTHSPGRVTAPARHGARVGGLLASEGLTSSVPGGRAGNREETGPSEAGEQAGGDPAEPLPAASATRPLYFTPRPPFPLVPAGILATLNGPNNNTLL